MGEAAHGSDPSTPERGAWVRDARIAPAGRRLETHPRAHPGTGGRGLEGPHPRRRGAAVEPHARRRRPHTRDIPHPLEIHAPALGPAPRRAHGGLDAELPDTRRAPERRRLQLPGQGSRAGGERQQQGEARPQAGTPARREPRGEGDRRQRQGAPHTQQPAVCQQDAEGLGAHQGRKESPHGRTRTGPGKPER